MRSAGSGKRMGPSEICVVFPLLLSCGIIVSRKQRKEEEDEKNCDQCAMDAGTL